jgi:hypothetical protein
MIDSAVSSELSARKRWSRWHLIALERLPIPYWITVIILSLVTVAEQALESFLSDRFSGVAPIFRLGDAVVIIGFVAFVLIYLWVVKHESILELSRLRPSVRIDDEAYDKHVRAMLRADWRVELILFGLGILIAGILYTGPINGLVTAVMKLWIGPIILIFVGSIYLVLFWLLLMLAYTGVRYGQALSALSRSSLTIDVFDNSHLLPFGRLSLLASLWLVGIILIPLIVLGLPTRGGYLIIGLSSVSLCVLFIPLWGVHRQMAQVKHQVLVNIHEQFMKVQESLLRSDGHEPHELKALAERASTLADLLKHVHAGPAWPFARGGILRAVFASASPLIYFFLNQLILNYLIPVLRK